MAFSPGGVLLVTDMSDGTVLAFPDPKHTGHAERMVPVLNGLNAPHGIAFHNGKLYVAEINAVRRYDWDEAQLRAGNPQKIVDLPGSGGGHSTRTILFANGKMYVAVGSSCNVCDEDDNRRAAVTEYNEDGSGERTLRLGIEKCRRADGESKNQHASGRPTTAATGWATTFHRRKSTIWGRRAETWAGHIAMADRVPDHSQSKDYDCSKTIAPKVEMQAHSAPLGLLFYDGEYVSRGISRQSVCDFSRIVEPQHAYRIQSRPHKVQRQGRATRPAGRFHQRMDSSRGNEERCAGWEGRLGLWSALMGRCM